MGGDGWLREERRNRYWPLANWPQMTAVQLLALELSGVIKAPHYCPGRVKHRGRDDLTQHQGGCWSLSSVGSPFLSRSRPSFSWLLSPTSLASCIMFQACATSLGNASQKIPGFCSIHSAPLKEFQSLCDQLGPCPHFTDKETGASELRKLA